MWESWSECSKTCFSGKTPQPVRKRIRRLKKGSYIMKEIIPCEGITVCPIGNLTQFTSDYFNILNFKPTESILNIKSMLF